MSRPLHDCLLPLHVDRHSNACHFVEALFEVLVADLGSVQEQSWLLDLSHILFTHELLEVIDKLPVSSFIFERTWVQMLNVFIIKMQESLVSRLLGLRGCDALAGRRWGAFANVGGAVLTEWARHIHL